MHRCLNNGIFLMKLINFLNHLCLLYDFWFKSYSVLLMSDMVLFWHSLALMIDFCNLSITQFKSAVFYKIISLKA